jgi:SAM-dependent methyltransferase
MLAAMQPDAERWNRRYRDRGGPGRFQVEPVLEAHAALLGPPGRGLEIACGAAAHALWLAARGFHMTGVDISIEGLRLARAEAGRRGVPLALVVGDAARLPFVTGVSFDLIVVVRYLERGLFPWLAAALAPGGRLFYLTFNRGRLASHPGFNAGYLLDDGELQAAFPALERLAGEEGEESSWLIARRAGKRP